MGQEPARAAASLILGAAPDATTHSWDPGLAAIMILATVGFPFAVWGVFRLVYLCVPRSDRKPARRSG